MLLYRLSQAKLTVEFMTLAVTQNHLCICYKEQKKDASEFPSENCCVTFTIIIVIHKSKINKAPSIISFQVCVYELEWLE